MDWKKYCNFGILSYCFKSQSLGRAIKYNQCVLFFTDNEALVHVINRQSCRDPSLMSFAVRKLVSICLHHSILFKAKHIPGVQTKLAHCLSRLQVASFKKMASVSMC